MTIGYVDGRAVPRALVAARLAALRAGTWAAALPVPGGAEDRQLARWVAQVILTEELCAASIAGPLPSTVDTLDARAAVELGSVTAAAYLHSAAVRAVYVAVTGDVVVDEEDVRRYWAATSLPVPPRWVLNHRLDGGPSRRLGPVEAGKLPAAVAASLARALVGAAFQVTDGLGRHDIVVEEALPAREPCYERDAPEIRERLLGPARRRAFVRWLDRERAARIRLVPGFEHPGDPRQPDNRHRH